jgi:hypothetical protein
MRFELVIVTTLLAFATSQAVPEQQQQPSPKYLHFSDIENHLPYSPLEHDRLRRRVDLAFEWNKAWCKGAKLAQAMIKNEAQAATYIDPVRSPWDGNLVAAFRAWGYNERLHHRDDLCDFGAGQHDLQRAFADMKIGTESSANGGPNICYHIEHQNGPTVERDPSGQFPPVNRQYYSAGGRRLRVSKLGSINFVSQLNSGYPQETQAYTTLGINPVSGVIYFLNRLSPREAAHENWNIPLEEVKSRFLPDLSASSDHAWGFWNRAMAGGDLSKINKIFACMITNEVTQALIAEALRTYPLPPGVDPSQRPRGVEKWPGTSFEMHYDAAQALLGMSSFLNIFLMDRLPILTPVFRFS